MVSLIRFILAGCFAFVISVSGHCQSETPNNSIKVCFKKNSLVFDQTSSELDSLSVLIDSLIHKSLIIKITSISLSSEIDKDKFIDAKRSQVALNYFVKKRNINRGLFYIRAFINNHKSSDPFLQGKSYVYFEPMEKTAEQR